MACLFSLLLVEINESVLLCQPPLEKVPSTRVLRNMLHFEVSLVSTKGGEKDPEANGKLASSVAGCPLQLAETV